MNKKHIILIIGPAYSGKSEYINKNYPFYKKVDLNDYKTETGDNEEMFHACLQDFKKAIKDYDHVVLEHTLPKIRHRVPFLKAIAEVTKSYPEIVVLLPKENWWDSVNTTKRNENYNKIFEAPALSDGFSKVTVLY